jgi:hypothetical protein
MAKRKKKLTPEQKAAKKTAGRIHDSFHQREAKAGKASFDQRWDVRRRTHPKKRRSHFPPAE